MLTSKAKKFKVHYKFGTIFRELDNAVVDNISINDFNAPSTASFTMHAARAGDEQLIGHGSLIKITSGTAIVFMGIITANSLGAAGTSGGGTAFERVSFKAADYRYILSRTNVINGVTGHGYTDYDFTNFNPASSTSVVLSSTTWTYFSGIRAVFNPEGRGNMTKQPITIKWHESGATDEVYVFVEDIYNDRWTAKEMIKYLLFIGWGNFSTFFDVKSPADFEGLDHENFEQTPWHVAVEGLSLTDAIYAICKEVNMRFREVYDSGEPRWQFYQPRKIDADNCQYHELYCPAVGKQVNSLKTKRTWAFDIETDSSKQISYPITSSSPERYEITAQLVPSFANAVLTAAPSPLYIDETELAEMENPNSNDVFAKFDSRGSGFLQSALRLWTLNELGYYSFNPYNRDIPQDLFALIGADARQTIEGVESSRFGLHRRPLLPALTQLGLTSDSAGIRVDFSFDAGTTWQPLSCSIINIEDSGGIYIAEPNLHNIRPAGDLTIDGGVLNGEPLSLLTSIFNDILTARVFRLDPARLPEGATNWKTRIRVTACIELEQRKRTFAQGSSTPLYRDLYDFSDRYRYHKRAASSILTGTADEHDDTSQLQYQADTILKQNGSIRAAGTFTIDCIDLQFQPGDVIGEITGRNIILGAKAAADSEGNVYATGAEIVQVIHEPLAQTTRLITADDRFSE